VFKCAEAKLRWKEHIKEKRDELCLLINLFLCLNVLKPSYGGKSILRKNVMSSTSSSGKCTGCLDAILSCQSDIYSHYTSKLYIQF
jgi:hypothetical protein